MKRHILNNRGGLVQNLPLHDWNHIPLVDQLLVLHPAAVASGQALDVVENRLDALLASFFNASDCKKTFSGKIQGGEEEGEIKRAYKVTQARMLPAPALKNTLVCPSLGKKTFNEKIQREGLKKKKGSVVQL